MKKILTVVFLLLTGAAYSQQKSLQSIFWVSDNFGTLSFNQKGHLYWELDQSFKSYFRFMDIDFQYYQSKDTLILIDPYRKKPARGKVKHPVLYKFLLARTGNESLSVTPANDDAKEVIPNPPYVLKNIDYVDDPTIKFTSIHFDYGGASETVYPNPLVFRESTINIDDEGNYYLKKTTDGNTSHISYLKGKLSFKQLDSIKYILQHSEIRKLQNWRALVKADHSLEKNLVIAYNDGTLKIKTTIAPGVIGNLINYIDLLAKNLALTPDEQKHDFTQEGDLNDYR